MKKLIVLLVLLVAGFLGSWTYRIKTPVNRPDEYAEGYDSSAGEWWNTGYFEIYELDTCLKKRYSYNYEGNGMRYILRELLILLREKHSEPIHLSYETCRNLLKLRQNIFEKDGLSE